MEQHFVIDRPIAQDARHHWDFYLDGEEIKLHSYQLQQYDHKTLKFDIITHYLEGGSCTQDRLNVPMPVDVVREITRNFAIITDAPGLYVGPRYDSISDLLADNPDLATKVGEYVKTAEQNRTSSFKSR